MMCGLVEECKVTAEQDMIQELIDAIDMESAILDIEWTTRKGNYDKDLREDVF